MKSIFCTLATILLLLVLAGCGQSGPLYVPGDPSSIEMSPEAANDEEEDANGEDEDSP